MSMPLKLIILFLAIVLTHRIECIKLTKENWISLGGVFNEFDEKEISEIDPLALEDVGSKSLKLQNNELTYLQEDLFEYNSNFEDLYFDSNKISTIHPVAFQKLQNLTSIYLGENRLMEIAESLFERNTKLKTVSLFRNRITFIHPNTFSSLKTLEHLGVAYNQLTTFDLNLKLRFPKLGLISASNNEFNCSFANQFKNNLDEESIRTSAPITCISDQNYAAIVRDRQRVDGRQLSEELKNLQSKLDEEFNNLIVEKRNEMKVLKSLLRELSSNCKLRPNLAAVRALNSGRRGELRPEFSTGREYQLSRSRFDYTSRKNNYLNFN